MKQWNLHREDLLQPEEWIKFRRYLNDKAELAINHGYWTAVQDRAICFLAIWSGLRRSELSNLTLNDLFLTNERPYIIVRHGKGDKYREVLISPDCRAFLKQYLKMRDNNQKLLSSQLNTYLFIPQRGYKYTGDGIYRVWVSAMESAGLVARSIHKARHYNGTMLYQATKDMRFIQKQLGHSKITTTQIYADVTETAAEENLKDFDKELKSE